MRLAEVPGLGVDSTQQVIAEVGVQASTFLSGAELCRTVNHSLANGSPHLALLLSEVDGELEAGF